MPDHVGDQHGDRAVAGLDVIVDVPGQLVAGKIPRGDGQTWQLHPGRGQEAELELPRLFQLTLDAAEELLALFAQLP